MTKLMLNEGQCVEDVKQDSQFEMDASDFKGCDVGQRFLLSHHMIYSSSLSILLRQTSLHLLIFL